MNKSILGISTSVILSTTIIIVIIVITICAVAISLILNFLTI